MLLIPTEYLIKTSKRHAGLVTHTINLILS